MYPLQGYRCGSQQNQDVCSPESDTAEGSAQDHHLRWGWQVRQSRTHPLIVIARVATYVSLLVWQRVHSKPSEERWRSTQRRLDLPLLATPLIRSLVWQSPPTQPQHPGLPTPFSNGVFGMTLILASTSEAIQSRCAVLRYSKLSDAQILTRLLEVCDREKVSYWQGLCWSHVIQRHVWLCCVGTPHRWWVRGHRVHCSGRHETSQ